MNMRQGRESSMGNSSYTGMMVTSDILSARMEKCMEDREGTTRMESSYLMGYGRMAK